MYSPPERTVIFSSEYFSDLTPAEWRKVFALLAPTGRAVSSVTYFRSQVEQINSIFGQFIKSGFRPAPGNFVTYSLGERLCLAAHAYYKRARPLPFTGLELAAYDRAALTGGDIVTDFLTRVGRLTGASVPPLTASAEVNPSFNGAALSLKYALNLANPSMPENYAILRVLELIDAFRAGASGPELVLPAGEVERIEGHFAEDNARAVETFGETFEVLRRPVSARVAYVDVTCPPSAEAVEAFWTTWHQTVAEARPRRRALMTGLEPRLEAALEGAAPARA